MNGTHHHGNACTRHPESTRYGGRCRRCRADASHRYYSGLQADRRKLRAIEAALAL